MKIQSKNIVSKINILRDGLKSRVEIKKKNEIEDRSLKMIQSKEKTKSEKLLLTFMCNFS